MKLNKKNLLTLILTTMLSLSSVLAFATQAEECGDGEGQRPCPEVSVLQLVGEFLVGTVHAEDCLGDGSDAPEPPAPKRRTTGTGDTVSADVDDVTVIGD